MKLLAKIDGYMEIDGEVRRIHLFLWPEEKFTFYIAGDMHDGFDTLQELIDECGNKIYMSLDEYKAGCGKDLDKVLGQYAI